MITLDPGLDEAVDRHLAESVVDARLELVTRLGAKVLGRFAPTAGSIEWDGSARKGKLEVDVITDSSTLTTDHPVADVGQVTEAWWTWPFIGVSVPLGFWLHAEPERLDGEMWRMLAYPEGPARLDRARWWQPGGRVVSGLMGMQLSQMMSEARVPWVPAATLMEWQVPPTECEAGATILSTVERVIEQAGAEMRADRRGHGVVIGRTPTEVGYVDHEWADDSPTVMSIKGAPSSREVPNRITVWYETDTDGKRTVHGHSEGLLQGPRRWGGPYGQVPEVIKLDGPASTDAMRTQVRRLLRRRQEDAASIEVAMRADPRIEVGDTAHIVSAADGTDCKARVTAVKLNAANGQSSVSCAAVSGTVAGVPASYTTEL